MPSLVTGLFYERADAENAIAALKEQGIPGGNIFLESEVQPKAEESDSICQVSSVEKERRFAGLEAGLIIGGIAGLLSGICIGILGTTLQDMIDAANAGTGSIPTILTNPIVTTLCGLLIGLLGGGCIGWMVDYSLTKLGAGPALPEQETLVTVRVDDDRLDRVYGGLIKAHVRHLHAASNGNMN